jgi:hypothetical protein
VHPRGRSTRLTGCGILASLAFGSHPEDTKKRITFGKQIQQAFPAGGEVEVWDLRDHEVLDLRTTGATDRIKKENDRTST